MIRAIDKWLPDFLASHWRRPGRVEGPRHLCFCVADHFEPLGQGNSAADAAAVVHDWAEAYRRRFAHLRDADGRAPVHTFFYPAEEYDAACLEALVPLCRAGLGEVEIHLHHRADTAEGFAEKLVGFRDTLRRTHGLLGADATGAARYGFIHGNWALCNSRPDGDWCGVNAELGVLRRTGCYADFTFPSAPSPTQPRTVNTIYYARDAADGGPRGHDRGRPAQAGHAAGVAASDELLLIPGPLAVDWRRRKWGLLPRLENAELSGVNPPAARRVNLWAAQQIHVPGRADWIYIKVHTHGCVPANQRAILGDAMVAAHRHLHERFNDGRRWVLHYVSARELANLVLAAEAGCDGDPVQHRDHAIRPPAVCLPR